MYDYLESGESRTNGNGQGKITIASKRHRMSTNTTFLVVVPFYNFSSSMRSDICATCPMLFQTPCIYGTLVTAHSYSTSATRKRALPLSQGQRPCPLTCSPFSTRAITFSPARENSMDKKPSWSLLSFSSSSESKSARSGLFDRPRTTGVERPLLPMYSRS